MLAAGLCLAPGALPAAPLAPDEIRQRARSVVERDFQRRLPSPEEAAPPERRPSGANLAGVAMPALILLSVLGLVALVLGILGLIRLLLSRRRPDPVAPAAPPMEARSPEARSPETAFSLAEAERLAGLGRWSEAVHALLLVAIRQLGERFSIPLSSSRTSREICRTLPLRGEAREAFAGLVRTVEVSLFGGAPLGPDDYRASLERFRLLGGPR